MKESLGIRNSIEAVAFDIDGTLYPSLALYVRLFPYFFRHFRFFLKYNKVRRILHRTAPLADFYEYQGRLLAEMMGVSVEEARRMIDENVYQGLRPYFKNIRPFRHAVETVKKFREAGLKIAILSDFPPEQKGDVWGISAMCDVVMGSEVAGALKPSVYAFGLLGKALGIPREKILYVGNSIRCDVRGAKNAGMPVAFKQGFFRAALKLLFHIKVKDADIQFSSYKTLQRFVLG